MYSTVLEEHNDAGIWKDASYYKQLSIMYKNSLHMHKNYFYVAAEYRSALALAITVLQHLPCAAQSDMPTGL
jgi:hypothetical protein